MNELIWKVPDLQSVSVPASHWHRNRSADTDANNGTPRVAHSFANARVRQPVAPTLQAKLAVSHPADSAELEADRVADAVMSMPASQATVARDNDISLQRACGACEQKMDAAAAEKEEEAPAATQTGEEELARAEDDEELARAEDDEELARAEDDEELARAEDDEESALQAKAQAGGVPKVTPAIESQIQAVHSGGAPLDKGTRDFFEPRMGADLSGVRVHTGSQAASVARQLNARAFTVSNNITFGANQYQPSSPQGKRLLAHELTHVIQQGGAAPVRDNKEK